MDNYPPVRNVIAVASTSVIKLRAVSKAFGMNDQENNASAAAAAAVVVGFHTNSQVPEQPIGQDMGLLGANNRLLQVLAASSNLSSNVTSTDNIVYAVAIENFIQEESKHEWSDQACIVLKHIKSGKSQVMFSKKVRFPATFGIEAKRSGQTVGDLISKSFKGDSMVAVDSKDWFHVFHYPSRESLIVECLLEGLYKIHLGIINDFPKPGVTFVDMMPLLMEPIAWNAVVSRMASYIRGTVDVIAGCDSRGFLVGMAIAVVLKIPFVPLRKKGKLPPPIIATVTYGTEYSKDVMEIGASLQGQRVMIVDDLLATGGTLAASVTLCESAGAASVATCCLIELAFLHGRDKLSVPCWCPIVYHNDISVP